MKEYEIAIFDGFSNRKRRIMAESYDDAYWQSGIAGHPPGYISSVTLVSELPKDTE